MRKSLAFWAWTETLLLLEVHLKWLMIRTQLLNFPAGIALNLAVSYPASTINENLSQRLGIVILFEHTSYLAKSFDEKIITSNPELARSLGTPKRLRLRCRSSVSCPFSESFHGVVNT